jgi:hypothetical protein
MPACTLYVTTFLTEAGEYTDPTRIPQHCSMWLDTITLTPRCAMYTRERPQYISFFARLSHLQRPEDSIACNKSVQNPVHLEMLSQDESRLSC